MMLRFRFLWLLLASFWKEPLGLLDESVLNLIVFPNDVDITKISNDRYTALMDFRADGPGVSCRLKKGYNYKKWMPVVTFNTIR